MSFRPRLPVVGLVVVLTAMALALFGPASATAATLDAAHPNHDYETHLADNTIPAGIFCPAMDPAGTCGQVPFATAVNGLITADAVFPADSQVELQLCQVQTPDLTLDNCPRGNEVACTTAQAPEDTNPDGTVATFRQTITCPNLIVGPYELLVIPVFVATCPMPVDLFNPCFEGPGIDVGGTIALTAAGTGTGGGGNTFVDAEIKGAGEVGPQQHFSLDAEDDSYEWDAKHAEGKVRYQDDHSCKFRSKYLTLVRITFESTTDSGTAHIEGKGYVNNGKTLVDFTADAVDAGTKKDDHDQFRLNSPGCSNINSSLVKGSIEIKPDHKHGHD
jgi:hypothetical protein